MTEFAKMIDSKGPEIIKAARFLGMGGGEGAI